MKDLLQNLNKNINMADSLENELKYILKENSELFESFEYFIKIAKHSEEYILRIL